MAGLLWAGAAVTLLHRPTVSAHTAAGKPTARRAPDSQTASARAQGQAANWIARQVNPSAILVCDQVMCSALQAQGLAARRLLVLGLAATDPHGSDIVVATPAVRSQYSDRLASVYAPLLIARFGSGSARIEIRMVAAEGAAAFESRIAADLHARVAAGEQLLRNRHITATGTARAALTEGRVDPRLLVVLAALAALEHVRVIQFGDASPGAIDMPLRSAQIDAQSAATLAFLHAQQPPYLAMLVRGGQSPLTIQFDAPSPMGLGQ